jgi:hypothetical protein
MIRTLLSATVFTLNQKLGLILENRPTATVNLGTTSNDTKNGNKPSREQEDNSLRGM